jgi:integrase
MSVRKRAWRNRDGSTGEAWVAEYTDFEGKRRLRTFEKKREADAFHANAAGELRSGVHVPDSQSVTVAEAGRLWLVSCENDGLERATLEAYRQHLDRHIIPLLGAVKLSRLTVPMVRAFEDKLRLDRSPTMVRKARISLGALLADAEECGLVGQNVVHMLARRRRRRGQDVGIERRHNGKLKVGVDIPSPDEIRAIIAALPTIDEAARFRPLLLTAILTGLRASELRGLKWADIDLKHSEVHVRQRADRYGKIGRTKSEAGERTVPLPPMVVSVLREHRLACPNGALGLAFPNSKGSVDHRNTIVERGLHPAQVAAGVVDADGNAKYKGLHALRHFYASWCINRRVDGGLELPLKVVQARLGHASIQMTADTYGHLFPRGDDGAELAAAEKSLVG